MTDKQIIIEDCPHFIGGCCQEYLDGVCENHKCDLKIIRELEQKLKDKEQECEFSNLKIIQLQETLSQYETDLSTKDCIVETCKAQYKELKAELTRANCQIADDEILQCDMREAIEELKAENKNWQKEYWKLEQGNDFLAETNSRLKQTLAEIKEIARVGAFYWKHYKEESKRYNEILQKISECEGNND